MALSSENPASRIAYRVGCIGLASLFVLGALNKVSQFEITRATMSDVGLEPAGILLPLVIALEAIGGVMVATGLRLAWLAASALALFTMATNVIFHRFWELSGEIAALELSLFFKNIAIAGALIAVAAIEWQRRSTKG
jgi:putative oxidoreductase